MIDLRSDTVTRPTPGMLKAMCETEVGDDVFGEDPAMNRFQEKMAEMFGMESALFVPSGTMGNQLCVHLLTKPGDEVIIDETGHIFNYESAAAASLSGVQLRPLKGKYGKLNPELIESAIRTRNEWDPHTRVIALENTTNKGGGAFYTEDELLDINNVAVKNGLFLHLDGARIWNAMVASDLSPKFFGSISDTISICFSKGLGAPVGSMILADQELIRQARRIRKMWGGGMRQIGLLAAAADFAVDEHYSLLKEDHRRAKEFASAVSENKSLSIDLSSVFTNIVLFDVVNGTVDGVLKQLKGENIEMVQFGPSTIRATFHHQIDDSDLKFVIKAIKKV